MISTETTEVHRVVIRRSSMKVEAVMVEADILLSPNFTSNDRSIKNNLSNNSNKKKVNSSL
jgi:hypothetical protein